MKKMLAAALLLFLALQGLWSQNAGPGLVYTDASAFPLYGKAIEETSGRYQRFPLAYKEGMRTSLWNTSLNSTGLYIRFRSDAPEIHARWSTRMGHMPHMTDTGVSGLDLYALLDGKWHFAGSGFNWGGIKKDRERRLVGNMEPGMREYMLYLPLYDCLDSLSLGVPAGYTLQAPQADTPRTDAPIVMYGSSILQGGCASRPGMAFTAILSRWLDREIINLGFSGDAKIDDQLADLITRVKNPSVIVLDYVPNSPDSLIREKGEAFFRKVRDAHPGVPVVFVEDPTYPHGVLDQAIAKEVHDRNVAQAQLFLKLKKAGEKKLYYVSSKGMIGEDGEATVDGVHFTDLGMMRYANHILPVLKKALKNR